jgi:exonuclease SbcC
VPLTRLAAENFMGYRDLDLDLRGVVAAAIVGDNGAGKSTLQDLIRFVIDGDTRASIDRVVRHGAEGCKGRIEWESGGHTYAVTRERGRASGAPSTLGFEQDGETVTRHTIAETQRAILDVVGPSRVREAGPIMVQGQSGAFAEARPAERKAIFGDLLELDEWQPWHVEARERERASEAAEGQHGREIAGLENMAVLVAPLRVHEEALRAALAGLEARLEEATERGTKAREAIAAAAADGERRRLLLDQQSEANRRVLDLQRTSERERAAAIAPIAPLALDDVPDGAIEVHEAVLVNLRRRASAADRLMAEAPALLREHTTALASRAILPTVPCGGVGEFASCRFLTSVPSSETVAELERRAVMAGDALLAVRDAPAKVKEHEATIADLRGRREAARVATIQHEAKVTAAQEAATRAETAEATLATETDALMRLKAEVDALPPAEGVAEAQAALTAATNEVRDLRPKIAEHRQLVEKVVSNIGKAEDAAKQRADAYAARDKAAADRKLWNIVAQAFHRDGVPSMLVARKLPEVERRANAILDRMPGGLRLRLATEREKRGGGSQETLEIVVTKAGTEEAYELLGGGERFRVDLALRVALNAQSRRPGLDTIFIDEGFGTQHPDRVPDMADTMGSLIGEAGLVLVISHVPQVTERVPAVIMVKAWPDGNTATLQ